AGAAAPSGAAIPPAGPTGHRDDAHPADDGSGHADLAARAHPAAGTGPRGPVGRGILVVEDDPTFADLVAGVVRDAGFEAACARTAAQALDRLGGGGIAAVLLDVGLPDESGLALLERLKREPATRHLPIHVISASDHRQTAFGLGAAGYALKPVDRDTLVETLGRLRQRLEDRVRRVLVVEDGTLAEAGALRERERPDCIVLALVLPDGSGYDFLERHASAGAFAAPPIIVYTGRSITPDEEQRLRRYSSSIIVKGARSPERLLDEVTLFLHQVESDLPAAKRRMLEHARARDARLDGRRVLLAEDDARNVFALASALEPLGVELVVARNGNEAIERLERRHDIDLVLMDVMMPELDGLAATRLIRARPEWARLPVIALTAKAMPEDRLACMEAGANDYVSKPIDVGRLVSLLRVWLPA
nr:response regulator [Burkholderiaceae bacterium]